MVLILECMIVCFILLVPCVVAIANGIHNAAFLFERNVQDRVVEMGLVTRERLDRNKKVFKFVTLSIMVAFVIWAIYGINGARGFSCRFIFDTSRDREFDIYGTADIYRPHTD